MNLNQVTISSNCGNLIFLEIIAPLKLLELFSLLVLRVAGLLLVVSDVPLVDHALDVACCEVRILLILGKLFGLLLGMHSAGQLEVQSLGLSREEGAFKHGFEVIECHFLEGLELVGLPVEVVVVGSYLRPETLVFSTHVLVLFGELRLDRILLCLELFFCHLGDHGTAVHQELVDTLDEVL